MWPVPSIAALADAVVPASAIRAARVVGRRLISLGDPTGPRPTLLHLTHYKAGSQWVHHILDQLFREILVRPMPAGDHVFGAAIETGKVYPAVYVDKARIDALSLPSLASKFVVIRDLRDTLISWYFSVRYSHSADDPGITSARQQLESSDLETGMLYALDHGLPNIAQFQQSWMESPDLVVRYEDLLKNDEELFYDTLVRRCGAQVSRWRLRRAVRHARFTRSTGGRKRGQTDVTSHLRRGVAGDWRNYFSPKLTAAFKERYGDLLVRTGYEKSLAW